MINIINRREIIFEKNQPYHVLSRTVEQRKIFTEETDRYRFIFQMYAANIGSPAPNLQRKDIIKIAQAVLNGEEVPKKFVVFEHSPFVSFLSFAEVIDHYHFNLVQNIENGISKYMQKLNGGFAKYFNLKHNRKGNLFEKPYKIIPIQTNFQLDAILRYINVKNPLDVYQPGWRSKGLRNQAGAFEFLENYQFSSFPDLFRKRQSKILAPRSEIERYLGEEISKNQLDFQDFVKDYLQENLTIYAPFFLEE